MYQRIDEFVTRLAETRVNGPVVNQYAVIGRQSPLSVANAVRRNNLRLYLQRMAIAGAPALLVGEAPGYRGCRLTGVPFTSEAIILDERIGPFGRHAGYRKTAERETVVKEATATMLWSTIPQATPEPLLWNAFPFHPHQAGNPLSNRKPNKAEILQGAAILEAFIGLFPAKVVGAVGRCAARALNLAGVSDYQLLRHPSHGGKFEFGAGLTRLFSLDMVAHEQLLAACHFKPDSRP